MNDRASWREKNRVLVGVYAGEDDAHRAVKALIAADCQMDLVSMLGKIRAIGDDTLGIYYLGVGERMKGWGKQGALWGALWGLLAGASGLFLIPPLGWVAASGFIVEAIAGGAALGAGTLAGSAALSQLAVAFHRQGIPEGVIEKLHREVEAGHYVLMLRGAESELGQWRQEFDEGNPLEVLELPYSRFVDKGS